MTLIRVLWYAEWIAPALLQALVLAVMIRRRLVREFPVFVCYTAFEVALFAAKFSLFRLGDKYYGGYFYASWAGKIAELVLGFAVIHEIFSRVFKAYPALEKLGGLLFKWAAVVLLLLVVVASAAAPPTSGSQTVFTLFLVTRALWIMQCGLLSLLFLFSSYFGLSWRHYIFGIALGFGFYGTAELVLAALRTQFGPSWDTIFTATAPLAYNCAVLIWVSYLLRPEPLKRSISLKPEDGLRDWNHELLRLLNQ
jgi:hypothetical protein